jgi:hypothetical protein
MELRAEEWRLLSPEEQGKRCRRMAEEAQALSIGADPAVKLSYIKIAEEWLKLAQEVERSLKRH